MNNSKWVGTATTIKISLVALAASLFFCSPGRAGSLAAGLCESVNSAAPGHRAVGNTPPLHGAAIPEPSTWALAGTGVLGLLMFLRHRA